MDDLYYSIIKDVFKEDAQKFIDRLNDRPFRAFTINTLKADEKSITEMLDFSCLKSAISKMSYRHTNDDIGHTKAYELGLIYPQEESAAKTIDIVDFKRPNMIVDLCAAPGGKTIDTAIKTGDKSLIIANEVNRKRAMAILSNIERMGISNVIVTSKKTGDLLNDLRGQADVVIVDAPCSGMGMARKYNTIITDLKQSDIIRLAEIQKNILEDAYHIAKNGGLIIYSTCTYTHEENEDQIERFVCKHPDLKIVKGPLRMSFIDDSEGQFMCVMEKSHEEDGTKLKYLKTDNDQIVDSFIAEQLNVKDYYLYHINDNYYMSFVPLPDLKESVLRYGIFVGKKRAKIFVPEHSFYRANALRTYFKKVIALDDEMYDDFVIGKEIKVNSKDGYHLVTYKGYALGFGKVTDRILKNKYPKGLRHQN